MAFSDRVGAMDLSDERREESPAEGKVSKSNFLGLFGHDNFITTDALWVHDGSGSADSADTCEFPGSPKSLGSRSITSIGRSRSPFSSAFSASGESDVDKLIADLKQQNDSLRNELDNMQQSEIDFGFKLELAEDRLRKEIVMFEESASLKSDERDETSQGSERSAKQRQEIRETLSNFSLEYSFSHADELQYTKDKLAEAEEKLVLLSEGKAAMSAQPKPDPSKEQLEELMKKVVERDNKLLECEEDLVHLYRFIEDLEMKQEELERNVIIHKKEAEELRRQLSETKKELEETVAQRIAAESEVAQREKECSLQPSRNEEQKKMKKLRNENKELKKALSAVNRKSGSSLAKSQEHIASLQTEAAEVSNALQTSKSEIAQLKFQLHNAVSQYEHSEERFNDMKEELKKHIFVLQRENMQLRESVTTFEQQGQVEHSLSQEEYYLSLQTKLDEMEKEKVAIESELERRSSELNECQTSLSEKSNQLHEAHLLLDKSEKCQVQLKKAEETVSALEQERVMLKETLAQTEKKSEEDLKASLERLAETQIQVNEMKSSVKALNSEVEERSNQLMESQLLLSEKAEQLKEAEATFAKEVEELSTLRRENEELRDSLEKIKHDAQIELLGSKGKIEELQAELEAMGRTIHSLRSDAEKSSSILLEYQANLAGKSLQLKEAQEAMRLLQDENTKLRESYVKAEEKSRLELEASQGQVVELQHEVTGMKSILEELRSNIEVTSAKLKKSEAFSAEKAAQLQDALVRLHESRVSLTDTTKQLEESEAILAILKNEKPQLKQSLDEVEKQRFGDIESSQGRVAGLKTQVKEMSKTIDSLKAEVEAKSSDLRESEASVANRSKELKVVHAKFAQSQNLLADRTAQLEKVEEAFAVLEKESVQLKTKLAELEKKNASTLQESQERVSNLKLQVDEMKTTIESLQSEIKARSSKLLEMESSSADKSKNLELQKVEETAATLASMCQENMKLKNICASSEQLSQRSSQEAQEQVSRLHRQSEGMATTVRSLQCDLEEKSSKLLSTQISLDEKSKKLQDAEEQYASLHFESLKQDSAFAEVEKGSRLYMATARKRVASLQEEADEMPLALQSLQKECDSRASQLAESHTCLSQKTQQLEQAEKAMTKLEQEVVQLRQSLVTANEQAQSESKESRERAVLLQGECQKSRAMLEAIRSANEQQTLELVDSRALLSKKVIQLQEAESRFEHLQQKNTELMKSLAIAEVQSPCILPTTQESALIQNTVEGGTASITSSLQLSIVNQSPDFYEQREVQFGMPEPLPDVSDDKQIVAVQADVCETSQRGLVEAPDNDVSTRVQAQADEMTRTIHALRSQIEERTCRLLERKKMAKHSRQLQQVITKEANLLVDVDEWKRRTHESHSLSVIRGELLSSLQKDMESTLASSKETIQRLEKEVTQWKNMATVTEQAFDACQEEFLKTKQELQTVISSLDEALAHEDALKRQVSDLERSKARLEESLTDEKRQKEEALASLGQKMEEMRREYEAVINDMRELVTQELNEVDAEVCCLVDMHNKLLEGDKNGSSQFNEKLASYKQITDSATKCKSLQGTNENAKTASADDDEIEIFRSRTTSSDLESCGFSNQMIEISEMNQHLLDEMESMKDELQEENDSLQRQLGAKFDLFCKVQSQFEALQKEYNAVLSENRALRKDNSSIASLQKCVVSAITGSTEALSIRKSFGPPVRSKKERDLIIESLIH